MIVSKIYVSNVKKYLLLFLNVKANEINKICGPLKRQRKRPCYFKKNTGDQFRFREAKICIQSFRGVILLSFCFPVPM